MALSEVLGPSSVATRLLTALWLLAPYLALMAVMVIAERRTSLPAMAITAVLGAAGALTPLLMMAIVETDMAARLVPLYQTGAIAGLVPTCRRLTAGTEAKPPSR